MGDTSHTFESYYKRATSPLVVLQLLKDHVMYGYQISQAMQKMSDGPVYHRRALSDPVPSGGTGLYPGGSYGGD